jgi:ATP-dependent exoDNAse (exonuclease V) beta subunit
MVFGTAVHKTLENLILAFPTEMPAKEDVQRLWYSSIDQYKNHFDTIHLKHYKAYGLPMLLQCLPILFQLTNGAQYEIEKELHASLGEVLLKGRLDLMIIQESKIRVIDFKTGTGYDGFKPFVSIIDPGSPYWRQAAIYKLLVEQNYPGYDVEVEFHYVESGKQMKYDSILDPLPWHNFLARVWSQIHQLHVPAYVKPSYWN